MALSPELRARVEAHEQWYHSLDLAPGLVTPGWFDTRPVLDRIPFPADLGGARCLDVATFDGFWAFAMERRGAAEVVAVDLLDDREWDWPLRSRPEVVEAIGARKGHGVGFELAAEALGSSVTRLERSVYDLDPAEIGHFDFVYVGSLLLHLRDPIGALDAVRRVCRGSVLFVDAVDLALTLVRPRQPAATLDAVGRPWWWKPNRAGLVRMIESAGFDLVDRPTAVRVPAGAGQPRPTGVGALRALRHRAGRETVLRTSVGDPHLAVLARPCPSP